ncbi:ABC transporter ATP-binding protein/permease [Craterilacuibacter sp. RT1T]|uniref:ABC transporter ATP-binding protein/permease n=1 Tax=Craterilacuibacter sp. RT1T TaxID=2942211 RepID=UPI0020BE4AA9|nr:ABC transporter ATP-binding protein/permease [Craterilacuibacter sp. RT1T]MCL6262971.1 ABC transporter ATP-binding protein/permease [Craterilacuibacter sp. RT1T]
MNWSQELLNSSLWLLKAYSITLVIALLAGWALVRFSGWGKQFWRLSGDFFSLRHNPRPTLLLLAILFFTLFGVRMSVLFSQWYNQMYASLQKLDEQLFWVAMWGFAVLASVHIVRALTSFYLNQAFTLHWRQWLNERLLAGWLDKQAYFRSQYLATPADNPDQRLQQDVTSFAAMSLSLSMGVIDALVSTIEFTIILWGLSGVLNLFGTEIPRGMVFVVYVYVIIATVFAFKIGRPLIRLNFLNEKLNADYRYSLVRLREYGESVAFYRGEGVEGDKLRSRFSGIIGNAWAIVYRSLKFQGFNFIVSQTAAVFPFIIQAQRFFSKQITLGDMVQTAQAFGQLQDNLSFFRSAYDDFAGYRAVLDRLTGFVDAIEQADNLPSPQISTRGKLLALSALNIHTPQGRTLLSDATLSIKPGEPLLIRGRSGSGKTTLLRAIAGLWPYCEGHITRPEGRSIFLSQKPYLPQGTLRDALYYPSAAEAGDEAAKILALVQLGHLSSRLDESEEWAHILSLGEQQRLAFGRLLLAKPQSAFLDEATSAMDEGLEHTMYALVRERLPQTVLISVGHRSTLNSHHSHQLELLGEGRWQLA